MDEDGEHNAQGGAQDDDIYSDVDSEGFVQDMRDFGVNQALPLEAEGMDIDAATYFRAVRDEAARIPFVCASARRQVSDTEAAADSCQTTSIESQDPVFSSDPMYSWMCEVLNNFVAARAEVADHATRGRRLDEPTLPNVQDRRAWQRLIQQQDFQPYSAVLARMDNLLAVSCLTGLAEQAAAACSFSSHGAIWLYGLMVRLEKPIDPSVSAVLRSIVVLARTRPEAQIQALHKLTLTDVPATQDDEQRRREAAMYDTLLVLAGGFFGQDPSIAPLVDRVLTC